MRPPSAAPLLLALGLVWGLADPSRAATVTMNSGTYTFANKLDLRCAAAAAAGGAACGTGRLPLRRLASEAASVVISVPALMCMIL